MAGKLVLCRHGQSTWNRENLFTGWHDVDLTDKGLAEAISAGQLLGQLDFNFDVDQLTVQYFSSQRPNVHYGHIIRILNFNQRRKAFCFCRSLQSIVCYVVCLNHSVLIGPQFLCVTI